MIVQISFKRALYPSLDMLEMCAVGDAVSKGWKLSFWIKELPCDKIVFSSSRQYTCNRSQKFIHVGQRRAFSSHYSQLLCLYLHWTSPELIPLALLRNEMLNSAHVVRCSGSAEGRGCCQQLKVYTTHSCYFASVQLFPAQLQLQPLKKKQKKPNVLSA